MIRPITQSEKAYIRTVIETGSSSNAEVESLINFTWTLAMQVAILPASKQAYTHKGKLYYANDLNDLVSQILSEPENKAYSLQDIIDLVLDMNPVALD